MSCAFLNEGGIVMKATRSVPVAAAGSSLLVAVGLTVIGFLIVNDSRGEIADLVAVAQRAERAELVRFAGGQPDRCLYAGPGRELCRWEIAGTVVVPLGSAAIQGPLKLVCELPTGAARDQRGSCFVRGEAAAFAGAPLPPVSSAATPEQQARHAAAVLGEARTIAELSLLVGDAPESCHTVYAGQMCRWSLPEGSGGRERLAALAGDEGLFELRCLLPLEATGRPPESCAVVSVE